MAGIAVRSRACPLHSSWVRVPDIPGSRLDMRPIGFAVMGDGTDVRASILPAFARVSEHSRLVAVLARDRAEAQADAAAYNAAGYSHDELQQCLQRDDVDAVWLALP